MHLSSHASRNHIAKSQFDSEYVCDPCEYMKIYDVKECFYDFVFSLPYFLRPDEVINISAPNDDWVVGCTCGEDDVIFASTMTIMTIAL